MRKSNRSDDRICRSLVSGLCRDSAPSFGNRLKLCGTDGYQNRALEPHVTIIGPSMDHEMDSALQLISCDQTAAGPVLELKSGDALELAFIVGDESEPRGFGVSSNPEIVATDHLTAGLQRCANLAVGCRRFPRQGNHRQKRYKAPERFQGMCSLLASLCGII